jgi:hypothetical protein
MALALGWLVTMVAPKVMGREFVMA